MGTETDVTPKPTVPVADSVAGVPPVDPGSGGVDLAATIKDAIADGFKGLFGRGPAAGGEDSEGPGDGEEDDRDGPVTAPGKTVEERARRGPTHEQDVAAQTRAELAKIKAEEKDDQQNAELRAEIEGLKGQVKALSEKPPEQYNRLTKAIWG